MIKKHGAGGNYWLDIWVGKNRVRRSLHTPEHALAIERARDITLELRRPKPAGTLIAEFVPKYLEWARQTKPSSAAGEAYRVGVMKTWFNNAAILTLEAITPYHIEQFRASVMTRKIGHTTKTLSRSSANKYLALLRVMLNRAEAWGMFSGPNPVRKVKFYREGGKIRPLTDAEIEKALETARAIGAKPGASPVALALYDICRLILFTGLRRSEILNMRWLDVGDDELTIRGKGGKIRSIPLNSEAHGIIESQSRSGPFVFDVPNRNSRNVLRRVTETISRHIGVPFHVHLLRHAFASRLLAAGVDIVTVGDILGHSSAMVSLLYTHSSPARKRQAVDMLTGHRHDSVPG